MPVPSDDELWDLSDPRVRWALARAGGWCSYYGPPIGYYEAEDSMGVLRRFPLYVYADTRDPAKACPGYITDCSRLGCERAGRCLLR